MDSAEYGVTDRYIEMARDHIQRSLRQPTHQQAAFYLDQARAVLAGGLYDPEADHRVLKAFDVAAEAEAEGRRLAGRDI